jgi:NAD(P)H-dependent FMN reductase
MPNLLIIIASTRPGRAGLPVARWFEPVATAHGTFDVTVADLAEWNLPFLDEPKHPKLREYTKEHTRRWSAEVDAADAFVFVMPEYNHGFNAPLKNAIDYLHQEWAHKPAGFVSYGGVGAGMRAVQQLKQVLISLNMLPVNDAGGDPVHREADPGRRAGRPRGAGAGRRRDADRARPRGRGSALPARGNTARVVTPI